MKAPGVVAVAQMVPAPPIYILLLFFPGSRQLTLLGGVESVLHGLFLLKTNVGPMAESTQAGPLVL